MVSVVHVRIYKLYMGVHVTVIKDEIMSFGRWTLEELKTGQGHGGQGNGSDADTVLMYDIFKKLINKNMDI